MSAGWHVGNDTAAGDLSHFSTQGKGQVRRTRDKGGKEKMLSDLAVDLPLSDEL